MEKWADDFLTALRNMTDEDFENQYGDIEYLNEIGPDAIEYCYSIKDILPSICKFRYSDAEIYSHFVFIFPLENANIFPMHSTFGMTI